MKRSVDRILTTHTGSLPRPPDLVAMILAHEKGEDDPRFPDRLHSAVADIVQQERDADVDVINDGEQGKINYYTYINERLTGFEGILKADRWPTCSTSLVSSDGSWWATQEAQQNVRMLACNGPISVKTLEPLKRDIKNLQDATASTAAEEVFMSAVSPGLIASGHGNSYYPTREEFLEAVAEAMRQEYEAIANAGFVLHLDCPDLAMGRHLFYKEKSLEEFRRLAAENVDALNYATRNIDPDQMRMHLLLGQLRRTASQGHTTAGHPGRRPQRPAERHRRGSGEPSACPRVAGIRGQQAARRQDHHSRGPRLDEQLHRAPRSGRRQARQLCPDRRPGERHRGHRLWLRHRRRTGLGSPNVTWAKFKSMAEGARIATQRSAAVGA